MGLHYGNKQGEVIFQAKGTVNTVMPLMPNQQVKMIPVLVVHESSVHSILQKTSAFITFHYKVISVFSADANKSVTGGIICCLDDRMNEM